MREIVFIDRSFVKTTSLIVAEKFGKQHGHILRDVKKIIGMDERGLLKFGESSYVNEQNKIQPMYIFGRKEFEILVMGFTGKKAFDWKIKYADAFEAMEKALLQRQNVSWIEARATGKEARHLETDAIQRFVEYAKAQGSTHAEHYYGLLTKATYKALYLIAHNVKIPSQFRNLLSRMQLSSLKLAELLVQEVLEEEMAKGTHYKTIYKLAEAKVLCLAEAVGVRPVALIA